jgi:4'-phosphopantetheinyl transferase EntD
MFSSPFRSEIAFSIKTHKDSHEEIHPEEEELIGARAVEKRRREFRLGRAAAHSAIASLLGESRVPILKGEKGEPLWPAGLVGAISHSEGLAAAAVGRRIQTEGIGLDLEPLYEQVPLEISDLICTPQEFLWIESSPREAGLRLKMLFSAKESIFKAFYPIDKIYLDFKDAELTWDEHKRSFRARFLRRPSRHHPEGYVVEVGCRTTEDYLFTFLALPAHSPDHRTRSEAIL